MRACRSQMNIRACIHGPFELIDGTESTTTFTSEYPVMVRTRAGQRGRVNSKEEIATEPSIVQLSLQYI